MDLWNQIKKHCGLVILAVIFLIYFVFGKEGFYLQGGENNESNLSEDQFIGGEDDVIEEERSSFRMETDATFDQYDVNSDNLLDKDEFEDLIQNYGDDSGTNKDLSVQEKQAAAAKEAEAARLDPQFMQDLQDEAEGEGMEGVFKLIERGLPRDKALKMWVSYGQEVFMTDTQIYDAEEKSVYVEPFTQMEREQDEIDTKLYRDSQKGGSNCSSHDEEKIGGEGHHDEMLGGYGDEMEYNKIDGGDAHEHADNTVHKYDQTVGGGSYDAFDASDYAAF